MTPAPPPFPALAAILADAEWLARWAGVPAYDLRLVLLQQALDDAREDAKRAARVQALQA